MSNLLTTQLQKLVDMNDEHLVAEIRAKSARQCMGEFLLALSQLVVYHQVPFEVTQLSLNFHGGAMRVDIAKLTDDGQHLEQWLVGLNANMADQHFGAAAPLPDSGRPQ